MSAGLTGVPLYGLISVIDCVLVVKRHPDSGGLLEPVSLGWLVL